MICSCIFVFIFLNFKRNYKIKTFLDIPPSKTHQGAVVKSSHETDYNAKSLEVFYLMYQIMCTEKTNRFSISIRVDAAAFDSITYANY